MTLEEFQELCEKKIREGKEAERRILEEQEKKKKLQRHYGLYKDFIKEEDGHWIVVKNNEIVEHCDTKSKAWQILNSY